MLTATFWGLVGGAALLVGALLGLYARASNRVIGIVMAFGAGVLISAVAFELTEDAYRSGGATPVVIGLVSGSLVFFAGDWLIDRRGGHRRKSPTGEHQQGAGALALVLGALLDGIPESAAIGVSVLGGGEVGVAMVAAVFLSNVPESMSASAGLSGPGARRGTCSGCGSSSCSLPGRQPVWDTFCCKVPRPRRSRSSRPSPRAPSSRCSRTR